MAPTSEEKTQRKSLSTRESQVLSRLASENRQVISIGDIANALDIPRKSAKDMAYALKEKGWLERIAHGKYLIMPLAAGENPVYTEHEFVIASALVEPMYIGYWSAMNHHGLSEQLSRTVYIVTTTRAQKREIHGVTYRPVTVTEQKFFGSQPTAVGTNQVNISSIEKTLVDCADHPEFCGGIGELAKAMQNAADTRCSWERVIEYLRRVRNGAATKRIVYLADQLDIDLPGYSSVVENFTTGYPLLDPTRKAKGTRDSKYQLRLNVSPESFLPEDRS
ncbi:transcriptional regulator [Haloferax sp. Atlit-10N]|uniref:type IV toxin-antitoxin system AbiEi family antitoxin domain-containing protein n=1 Tax=unclassified Haloferax TaxID=2625095 RepID=UPI000E25D028|nr:MULTISPECIES: type IV toxin-antitoxin system AbiEi family antitoxin [unclassified Haloferax]RDZ44876.1 transcriptional regulator [Haloferax sp. Atlit-16N]RDZ48228.1 transcriptional regulator [Haloferax sp. Atlit-19N]RDZ59346.1 transcriptional regulator [Haloferax sp. Atlit-10N]